MRILFYILLFIPQFVFSTDYYFANAGNDGNACSFGSQCASTTKADLLLQTPGTRVFFNRGDVFIGQLHLNAANCSVLAFGTGVDPVITGFVQLGSWTSRGSNLYQAYCPTCQTVTSVVQFNNYDQPMGRYPDTTAANGGYLVYPSGTTSSIVADVTDPTTTWTGATAIVRTNNFTIDPGIISSESGGTINFSNTLSATPTAGYGYFIQNDIRTLTTVGEWFWKSSVDSLIMDFVGTTPGANQVGVSSIDTLISIGANFITIDGVDIRGANKYAVAFTTNSNNDTIRNDTISYIGINGIENGQIIKDCSFSYATIKNIHNNAISVIFPGEMDTTEIRQNAFSNISIIPGAGARAGASYCGITLYGYRDSIINNTFTNLGGSGTTIFGGHGNVWRYNFINIFDRVMCDGGGIYGSVHDGTVNTVIDNIILNGIGQHFGTTLPANIYANGIYLDNGAQAWDVERNTCAYNSYSGIYTHYTKICTINNNTAFKNTTYQWYIQEDNSVDTMRRNTLLYNKWVSGDSVSTVVGYYIAANNDLNLIATKMDSSYYTRPPRDGTTFHGTAGGQEFLTLAGWQSRTTMDAHSKKALTTVSNNNQMFLFYNATTSAAPVTIPQGLIDVTGAHYNPGPHTLQPFQSLVLLSAPIDSFLWLNR